MKNQLFKIIFIAGLAAVIAGANSAVSQSNIQDILGSDIIKQSTKNFFVEFSPENPGPNTNVQARLVSYTFDANRAEIAWIIGGKVAGTGKTFSFTTAGLGTKTSLTVSVITDDKSALSKNFSFRAVDVDLLWETDGYAPPYYRGKILPVAKSFIKVMAVPAGFSSSDSRLIYEWRRNEKNIVDASGQGKKTFGFYAQEAGKELIEVKILSLDGTSIASKIIGIPITEPRIVFYAENSLEGPQYQKALGPLFTLNAPELILRAEPFFFSKRALPLLSYKWKMNNKEIPNPTKPNVLNLSVPAETKGTSFIYLEMENPENILERASKNLQVQFNFQ